MLKRGLFVNATWLRRGAIALTASAVILSGLGSTAAFADATPAPVGVADDGEPIWSEGDQDAAPAPKAVPGIGAAAAEAAAEDDDPGVSTQSVYCDPGRSYTLTNTKNSFDIKYRETDDNSKNKSDDTWNITVTSSGTTTFGVSVNVEEEISAGIFAKVKASINGSISHSMSTTTGTSHTTTVKAGHIVRAEYGIWRENFKWKTHYLYSNCDTSATKSGSGHAPYSIKWRWIQVK
jgi:hypothetical protein